MLLVTLLPGAPPALAWMASCPDRDQDPKAQRGNFPSLSAALFGVKFKLPWYPGTKAIRPLGLDRAAPGIPGDQPLAELHRGLSVSPKWRPEVHAVARTLLSEPFQMKFQAACPHDVLLVIAEVGMVVLAVRGPWALMAGCDVAESGRALVSRDGPCGPKPGHGGRPGGAST